MVFIWGDRGYLAVRFEYKTAFERYLVAEIEAKQFWVFLIKIKLMIYFENTQNCFAYLYFVGGRRKNLTHADRGEGSTKIWHLLMGGRGGAPKWPKKGWRQKWTAPYGTYFLLTTLDTYICNLHIPHYYTYWIITLHFVYCTWLNKLNTLHYVNSTLQIF